MQHLKTFSKIFNTLLPFTDFLYILQQEEYSTKRLLKWLPKFFFRRNIQQRESLVLTRRALSTLLLSFIIWVTIALLGVFFLRNSMLLVILFFFTLFISIPIFVLISNLLFTLLEESLRKGLRLKAAKLIKKNQQMKIVTIAGSYGKTTVKNFVYQLAKFSYKTQMIPGNINTPSGIANWILANLSSSTELLIAEVDAYEIGEIAKSCDILNADIAILTGVGDQHVERFGARINLATALSEVFSHSKASAVRICSQDTKDEISQSLKALENLRIINLKAKLEYGNLALPTPELSDSNLVNLHFALAVAEELHLAFDFTKDTIMHLELPERRQQMTTILGYDGVDDSYNISFTTAKAGILAAKKLATQKGKKLLVITAGIPELSKDNLDKNTKLGQFLSSQANHTIILGSMFADEIKQGFSKPEDFTQVETLRDFVSSISKEFTPDEWYLLLQPELNDLYY